MDNEKKVYLDDTDTEADTCRKKITPLLHDCGWDDDKILEQRVFTDGKIIVIGKKPKRKKAKKADYILRYSQNFPIAIVEAKSIYKKPGDGLQQAKRYAEILNLKFAYATNGEGIVEYDFITGLENPIEKFPSPEELWTRLQATTPITDNSKELLLKPFFPVPDKPVRYYQTLAINKAIEAILNGEKRILLTLATGTGKTTIAFQIIYKLWNNRWSLKGTGFKPKILYLSDRSILVSDPHSREFSELGSARCLVPEDGLVTSREVFFSTYQSLAEDESRIGAFREFKRDHFDLIVVDECHRGSASDESNWRNILQYFDSAVQIGMTATPLREDNKDTYKYFGNPVYTYSLKQGIEDGFLAPYIVRRVVSDVDAMGWRPQKGQVDAKGKKIPDGVYTTPDFQVTLSHLPRTRAVAKHLTEFMKKNGRFDKTIVFCVDQEHADHFKREFNNLNSDLTKANSNYVVRIVSEEGETGKGHLSNFMDVDKQIPVVVTTSRLLSTGVDIPTCKNIVIFRMVNSITEFKQIVGRGTRVRVDKEKYYFNILDYTGSATRNFADPEFDGMPPLITNEEIDDEGNTKENTYIEQFPEWTGKEEIDSDDDDTDIPDTTDTEKNKRIKYYVEAGEVSIVAEKIQILGSDGKLKTVEYSQFAKEQIKTLFHTIDELKKSWNDIERRKLLIENLEDRGLSLDQLYEITKQFDADPFDLLCFVAYDLKPKTRKERAELLRKNKPDLFNNLSEKAREVLNLILDKYIEFGYQQIQPSIIKVEPISRVGNPLEIISAFGGMENFKKSITDVQQMLYLSTE
ncbi:MAG: hypothetical protein DAHOPDDO_00056 [Ignavibacteriaceae bacterium]|nr:hypothetical protein [Ignavibacteriaceae bacterium]